MKQKTQTEITTSMLKPKLTQLLSRYKPLGVIMGGELCLRPNDALDLVSDLEALGVPIMGLDGWYYAGQEHKEDGLLAQDLGVDLYVGDEVLQGSELVRDSADIVREYVMHSLPERTELVSFTLDVPPEWDLFPRATS